VGYSKFCNKLWNVTRFAFRYIEEANPNGFTPALLDAKMSLVDADGAAPRRAAPLHSSEPPPAPPSAPPHCTRAPSCASASLTPTLTLTLTLNPHPHPHPQPSPSPSP
jgi:hypothetical protein